MIVKVIVVILLVFIIYSLGSALYFLVNEKNEKRGSSTDVVKSLSWRIALSLFLFILLFFSYWMGWIVPHQI